MMRFSDTMHGGGVRFVETPFHDLGPVPELRGLRPSHVLGALEHRGGLAELPHMGIETVQQSGELPEDEVLVPPEQCACRAVDLIEVQPPLESVVILHEVQVAIQCDRRVTLGTLIRIY